MLTYTPPPPPTHTQPKKWEPAVNSKNYWNFCELWNDMWPVTCDLYFSPRLVRTYTVQDFFFNLQTIREIKKIILEFNLQTILVQSWLQSMI